MFSVFTRQQLLGVFKTAVIGHISAKQPEHSLAAEVVGPVGFAQLTVNRDCKLDGFYLTDYTGYEGAEERPLVAIDIVKEGHLRE
jgi:hypothetical protein